MTQGSHLQQLAPRRLEGSALIAAHGPQEEVVAGDYLPVLRLSSF